MSQKKMLLMIFFLSSELSRSRDGLITRGVSLLLLYDRPDRERSTWRKCMKASGLQRGPPCRHHERNLADPVSDASGVGYIYYEIAVSKSLQGSWRWGPYEIDHDLKYLAKFLLQKSGLDQNTNKVLPRVATYHEYPGHPQQR